VALTWVVAEKKGRGTLFNVEPAWVPHLLGQG
jgi:hypothetical protein